MSADRYFIRCAGGRFTGWISLEKPPLLHREACGQQDGFGQDLGRQCRQAGGFEGPDQAEVSSKSLLRLACLL
ncbi:hypothetical protein [Pseudarthrobacter phenanthrenivorans]|uniref:hypothetical protein n=1 Tax=Pseudarthrobacter phenanthrenivorans TaxID=361575 RepID=UPI0006750182|nr:hypothetical protein [Pseudarthrobacter phenanthrenivorans]